MNLRFVLPLALLAMPLVVACSDRTCAFASGFSQAQQERISFQAEAFHEVSTDSDEFWTVELTIRADQGWHLYRPGVDQFTIPVEPLLEFPVGARQIGQWQYPVRDGDAGYLVDGQKISCRISAPDAATVQQIGIRVRYQACSDSVCLPPKTIELALKTGSRPDPPAPVVQNETALDVLNQPVNNREIYALVLEQARKTIALPGHPGIDELIRQLKQGEAASDLPVPSTPSPPADQVYQSMVRASLIVASVYDCGKCDQQHVSTAGGVVVGADGLVLTNYHVVDKSSPGTLGLVAVTCEGVCHPVVEVLSASASDDVALIRLGGDTSGLHPAPVAARPPGPMAPVVIISHPHREYFVLTEGRVSRYVTDPRPGRTGTVWMETTADYGAGSSGSAVFDETGAVVGLVSTVYPLIRKGDTPDAAHPPEEGKNPAPGPAGKPDLLEMLLHRCVPLDAIRNRFAGSN